MIINQSFTLSALLTLLLLMAGCTSKTTTAEYIPKEGDLAFQISEPSEFVKAITDASAQRDSIKFAHVGIVVVEGKKPYILEATPKGGVKLTTLEDYLSEAETIGGMPGVVIKRIAMNNFPIRDAIARAKSYIGQEYDWNFLPDNGKMYCSELVYDSFLDAEGHHLFQASPMNFLDYEGNVPAYWSDLFSRLGTEIPQGVPGTNPQDMSRDTILYEVYSYF